VKNSSNGHANVSKPIATNLGTLLMSTTQVTTTTIATSQIVHVATVIYPHVGTMTFSSSDSTHTDYNVEELVL
jgi:hypothetical protein